MMCAQCLEMGILSGKKAVRKCYACAKDLCDECGTWELHGRCEACRIENRPAWGMHNEDAIKEQVESDLEDHAIEYGMENWREITESQMRVQEKEIETDELRHHERL